MITPVRPEAPAGGLTMIGGSLMDQRPSGIRYLVARGWRQVRSRFSIPFTLAYRGDRKWGWSTSWTPTLNFRPGA